MTYKTRQTHWLYLLFFCSLPPSPDYINRLKSIFPLLSPVFIWRKKEAWPPPSKHLPSFSLSLSLSLHPLHWARKKLKSISILLSGCDVSVWIVRLSPLVNLNTQILPNWDGQSDGGREENQRAGRKRSFEAPTENTNTLRRKRNAAKRTTFMRSYE